MACLQSFFPLTVSTSQLNVYAQPSSEPTPPPVVTAAPRPPVTIQEANSSGPLLIVPEQQATPAPLGAPLVAPVASPPAEVSSGAVYPIAAGPVVATAGWHPLPASGHALGTSCSWVGF